ncbi:hypothetical protein HY413_01220 [Candidatus Kaiserbacteria bacterium]|nr:hypothetical protein [Candidatus Kaiserbacteria bacterium]
MFGHDTQFIIDFDSTLVSLETLDELAKITLADDIWDSFDKVNAES